jgi:hypothetical protein
MAKKTALANAKSNVGKTVAFLGMQPGKAASNIGLVAGTMVTITGVRGSNSTGITTYNVSVNGQNYGFCYEYELHLAPETVEELTLKITECKERIKETEEEIADLESKIDFMKEQGLEVLDAEGYKAFKVLKVLGLGSYAQAMEIVKILG